jgi:hypothetical protein
MATILPLKGKYYGTVVELKDGTQIEIWAPDHFANPFGSEREIANGWKPEDGHDHVEDQRSLEIAKVVETYCNMKGW